MTNHNKETPTPSTVPLLRTNWHFNQIIKQPKAYKNGSQWTSRFQKFKLLYAGESARSQLMAQCCKKQILTCFWQQMFDVQNMKTSNRDQMLFDGAFCDRLMSAYIPIDF